MKICEENFEEIIERFRGFIGKKKDTWFVPGTDPADLEQEIRMIVLNCIRRWDPQRGVPFWPYLKRAVNNRLYNLSARAQRRKHLMSEFSYVRFGVDVFPIDGEPWLQQIPDPELEPDVEVASREFVTAVADLSPTCEAVVAELVRGEARGITREDILEARREVRLYFRDHVERWRQGLRRPVVRDKKVIGWKRAHALVRME